MLGFVAKIRTVKISSGASGGIFTKVCTRRNFPLYSTFTRVSNGIYLSLGQGWGSTVEYEWWNLYMYIVFTYMCSSLEQLHVNV